MRILFFLLLIFGVLHAKLGEEPDYGQAGSPWFTGPLLCPSSNVIRQGHFGVEPYLFAFASTGIYDNGWKAQETSTLWNINNQTLFGIGIFEWMSCQFTTSVFWNYSQGVAHWENGDWYAQCDFQLLQPNQLSWQWLPSIKFTLRETIPLGRYRNLNPANFRTDVSGAGSWVTTAALIFGKLIHIKKDHYLSLRSFFSFNIPAPVQVKGFNAYGGGYKTRGRVFPGVFGVADLAFEYCISKRWVLAMDLVGEWSAKNRFSGNRGVGIDGRPASIGSKASVEYSLAPALEYNWNEHLGIIAGPWFTVAGKNTIQFFSGVVALSYYN